MRYPLRALILGATLIHLAASRASAAVPAPLTEAIDRALEPRGILARAWPARVRLKKALERAVAELPETSPERALARWSLWIQDPPPELRASLAGTRWSDDALLGNMEMALRAILAEPTMPLATRIARAGLAAARAARDPAVGEEIVALAVNTAQGVAVETGTRPRVEAVVREVRAGDLEDPAAFREILRVLAGEEGAAPRAPDPRRARFRELWEGVE